MPELSEQNRALIERELGTFVAGALVRSPLQGDISTPEINRLLNAARAEAAAPEPLRVAGDEVERRLHAIRVFYFEALEEANWALSQASLAEVNAHCDAILALIEPSAGKELGADLSQLQPAESGTGPQPHANKEAVGNWICTRCGRDEIDARANGCTRGPCPMVPR